MHDAFSSRKLHGLYEGMGRPYNQWQCQISCQEWSWSWGYRYSNRCLLTSGPSLAQQEHLPFSTSHSLPPIFLCFISILLKGAKKYETQHVLFLSMQTPPYLGDLYLSCGLHPNFVCVTWVSVDQEPLKPSSQGGVQNGCMKVYKRNRINKRRCNESPLQSHWNLWLFYSVRFCLGFEGFALKNEFLYFLLNSINGSE